MVFFDNINLEATNESPTSEKVKEYLLWLIRKDNQPHNPARFRESIDWLRFLTIISDPDAQITTYCAEAFEQLESIGCLDFKTEHPNYTFELLIEPINLPAFKNGMEDEVKIDTGLEKNVQKFVQIPKENARACQAFG